MHDIIFCFEHSDKKYYGELLSPATNIVILNLFQDFFCLSLIFLPIFSLSSPLITYSVSFSLSNYYCGVQGLYQAMSEANSLTCLTPTKILLLLNHLKTIILKTFHRYAGVQCFLNGF